MLEIGLILALTISAVPVLELTDSSACLDERELRDALSELLAEQPEADMLTLTLRVEPVHPASGNASLWLRLRAVDGAVLVERQLSFAPADCPVLPRLVASVVARHVEDLPGEWWRTRVEPAEVVDIEAGPQAEREQRAKPKGWSLRLGLGPGLAIGLGLSPPTLEPYGLLRTSVGMRTGIRLVLGTQVSMHSHEVGVGSEQVFSLRAQAGPAFDLVFDSITLGPYLLMAGGAHIGAGSGFASVRVATLPLAAVHSGLLVHSRRGLYAVLDAEIPIILASFGEETKQAAYHEPWIRLSVSVGFMWDLIA